MARQLKKMSSASSWERSPTRRSNGHTELRMGGGLSLVFFGHRIRQSRHVTVPRAGRLIQKEIAVACRGFRILVDGDDDRLNVLIAPAFSRRHTTNFLQSLEEGRRLLLLVKPSHQCRSSILRGSPFLSLSRSAQRSSILLSILSSSASAEVVGKPAR